MTDDLEPRPTEPGAGFVTFPITLIAHPELTDFDVRLLLLLDQIGWREGDRDGQVHASNTQIAARIGRSASAVKRALGRVEAIRPHLIRRDLVSSSRRDTIHLVYDRYGRRREDVSVPAELEIRQDEPGAGRSFTSPVSSYQENPEHGPNRQDEASGGQECTAASAGHFCTPPPLLKLDHHHHHREVGAGQECPPIEHPARPASFAQPLNAAELVAWLPTVESDATLLGRLTKKVPLWVARLHDRQPGLGAKAIDWVQDAIIAACDKDDPVSYAERLLQGWVGQGGRPGIEVERRVVEPEADAATLPMPAIRFAPAPSRGRQAADLAARRSESLATLFQPREAE